MKSLLGRILGGYIYRYTLRRYTPAGNGSTTATTLLLFFLLVGFLFLSNFQWTKTSVSQPIVVKLWLLTGGDIPDFLTVSSQVKSSRSQLVTKYGKSTSSDTWRTEMKYTFRILKSLYACACKAK